jgi:hypothetical protein
MSAPKVKHLQRLPTSNQSLVLNADLQTGIKYLEPSEPGTCLHAKLVNILRESCVVIGAFTQPRRIENIRIAVTEPRQRCGVDSKLLFQQIALEILLAPYGNA